ncbi:MAG: alkaline phosphatase [Candidatus Latescibacterota bacterium]|nr:MAG: alkaline phosphatase [Candidatus Latescibacterota bacterium]
MTFFQYLRIRVAARATRQAILSRHLERLVVTAAIIAAVCVAVTSCRGGDDGAEAAMPQARNDASASTGSSTGSVVFIHPDGTGATTWAALRLLEVGPDGYTNWDKMDRTGLYRGHLKNSLASSSHGGATVHAYGVKASFGNYGTSERLPVTSRSGKDYSIMIEALKAGFAVGTINSGQIAEPGTGVFLASSHARSATDPITKQIIESGADIIMAGGEERLLPAGVTGRHGKKGVRKDGLNLIDTAEKLGYTVVYTRDELLALPDNTDKVLGVYSAGHTFNQASEEKLKKEGLPLFKNSVPSVAEMTEVALRILTHKGKQFLLVVEEEGTDNFANRGNATGTFECARRADAAIGVAMRYIDEHPSTLLLTAADSNAGGMSILAVGDREDFDSPLPATVRAGAPLDGRGGTQTPPFLAAPDQFGHRMAFGVVWAGTNDFGGGIIAKAHGLNADRLPNNVDNTVIYKMMYYTLFGRWLD